MDPNIFLAWPYKVIFLPNHGCPTKYIIFWSNVNIYWIFGRMNELIKSISCYLGTTFSLFALSSSQKMVRLRGMK